jgi:hypothetical protein
VVSEAPAADSAPTTTLTAEELSARLAAAAALAGTSEAALRDQWLREGLERFEALHRMQGAGRCSLRTGTITAGPVPLPVQQ